MVVSEYESCVHVYKSYLKKSRKLKKMTRFAIGKCTHSGVMSQTKRAKLKCINVFYVLVLVKFMFLFGGCSLMTSSLTSIGNHFVVLSGLHCAFKD